MSEQVKSLIPAALVPSGVKDDRQHALAQLFGEALAGIDLQKLIMNDPMNVDARLLPFMIREFGAQQFIDPDFPEHVQRRILANIQELKSLHGYDAGVRLGLSLLGMQANILHWHQEEPKGPANTHKITFLVGEALFDEDAVLGPRVIAAAHRMIDVTKRWSQESAIRVGVNMRRGLGLATAAAPLEIMRRKATASRPSSFKSNLAIASAAASLELIRPKGAARRPSRFTSGIGVMAGVSILQIHRVSARVA